MVKASELVLASGHGHVGHHGHHGTHQGASGHHTLRVGSGQVTHDSELHPVIEIHQDWEVGALKIKR